MDCTSKFRASHFDSLRKVACYLLQEFEIEPKQNFEKCLAHLNTLDVQDCFYVVSHLLRLAYEYPCSSESQFDRVLPLLRYSSKKIRDCGDATSRLCDFLYMLSYWLIDKRSDKFCGDLLNHWCDDYLSIFSRIHATGKYSCVEYWSYRYALNVINAVLSRFLQSIVYEHDSDRRKMEEFANSVQELACLEAANLVGFKSRWFGGVNKRAPNTPDECVARLLILIRMKCAVIKDKSCTFNRDYFVEPGRVVKLFMEQDDQLCELLLCDVMLAERNLSHNSHELLFYLLHNLNWTHDVLLDWIISPETTFLPYLTRYLKFAVKSMPNLKMAANNLSLRRQRELCSNSSDDSSDEECLFLKVTEQIGERQIIRHLCVPSLNTIEPRRCSEQSAEGPKIDILSNLQTTFQALVERIAALNDSQLLGFNANYLLKLLRLFLNGLTAL